MRLRDLWKAVDALLPVEARGGPSSAWIGNRLAEHVGTRLARNFHFEQLGLAAVVVVCGEELTRQGRQDAYPELMALATILLSEPILDFGEREMWPSGVQNALALLTLLRDEPGAQG